MLALLAWAALDILHIHRCSGGCGDVMFDMFYAGITNSLRSWPEGARVPETG